MKKNFTFKSLATTLATIALIAGASASVEAKVGGGMSHSAPSMSSAGPRSGGAVGMSRPNVVQAVRAPVAAPAPAQAMPGNAYRPLAQAAPAAAPGTPGWVKPALIGAAVGAAATYAVTDHPSAHPGNYGPGTNYNNGGTGYSPSQNQDQGYAPGPTYERPHEGGMGFFGFLGVLALLGAAGYGLHRLFKAAKESADFDTRLTYSRSLPAERTAASPIVPTDEQQAFVKRFTEVQMMNNAGDRDGLKKVTTAEMFEALEPSIGRSKTHVLTMSASIEDETEEAQRAVVSVRFTGRITESNEPEQLDEVWHFVRNHGSEDYLLAGIEQV